MSTDIPSEILAALARFSQRISIPQIDRVKQSAGFSGAGVWKIVQAHATWAVRRWPSPGLSATRIRGLHRLLEHLNRSGLNFVAAPLPCDTGETLIAVDNAWWQIEPWLAGSADFHAHPNEARLKAAMAALARWHLAAAKFVPDPDCREWFGSADAKPSPAVAERLTKVRQITPAGLAEFLRRIEQSPQGEWAALCCDLLRNVRQLQPSIGVELAAVEHQPFALLPCLRDVWHDHVLFTDDDVTGLIDASACRRENVATDLARLIGSLVEDDAASWSIALDTYRQHRPLSLAEEALMGVLDRSGVVLSAATWLEWLYRAGQTFADRDGVTRRLEHLQRRLGHLAATSGLHASRRL